MEKISFNRTRFIFFFIIILGIFLRVYKLDKYGLWQDEQWSVTTSVGVKYNMFDKVNFFNEWASPWRDNWWKNDTTWNNKNNFTSEHFWKFNKPVYVIEATIFASNNPAYNISLHYWIRIFGISDFSVRFFSALWGILVVFLAYPFAKLLFNSRGIALFAAFLFAIHPLLIIESQSAKAHSMAIFFSFLSTFLFFNIIKEKRSKFILAGYIAACTLALLTHMLTIYVLLGHILIMLFFIREKLLWYKMGLAGLIVSVFYSIWLFNGGFESLKFLGAFTQFIKINVNNPQWSGHLFFISFSPANYMRAVEKMILSFFGNTLYNKVYTNELRFRDLIVLFFIPVIMMVIGYLKTQQKGNRTEMLMLVVMMLAQLLFATVIGFKDNQLMQFFPVNSVHIIPYVMVLFAAISFKMLADEGIVKKLFSFLLVLQIAIILYSTSQIYFNAKDQGYNIVRTSNLYKSAANSIISAYRDKDTVIFQDWRIAQCTNLYLQGTPHILQKVDTAKRPGDKLLLSRYQSGDQIELFEFNGWR